MYGTTKHLGLRTQHTLSINRNLHRSSVAQQHRVGQTNERLLFSQLFQSIQPHNTKPNYALKRANHYDYTLIALNHISSHHTIIALPIDSTLSATSNLINYSGDSSIDDTVILSLLLASINEWSIRLAVRLLYEYAHINQSSYKSYILSLPLKHFTSPIFFDASTVESLQYQPIIQQLNRLCKTVDQTAKYIQANPVYSKLFNSMTVSSDLLGWAVFTVSSRAFNLGVDNDAYTMLPLIDMMNHSSTFQANVEIKYNDTNKTVRAVSTSDIPSNTELTLNYGRVSNDILLLQYGFSIDNNPYDMITIKYSIDNLTTAAELANIIQPFHKISIDKLAILNESINTHNNSIQLTHQFPTILFSSFKCLLSDDNEQSSSDLLSHYSQFDNPDTLSSIDRNVLLCLKSLLQLTAQTFPTSIELDVEQLKAVLLHQTKLIDQAKQQGHQLHTNDFIAVTQVLRYRIAKKRLIHDQIDSISNMLTTKKPIMLN